MFKRLFTLQLTIAVVVVLGTTRLDAQDLDLDRALAGREAVAVEVSPESPARKSLPHTAGLALIGAGLSVQDSQADDQRQVGLLKIIFGASVAASGALLAATSGQSATLTSTSPFGDSTIKVSARSTGRLIMGLVLVGGGSYLIWNGNKDRKEADNPSSSLGFGFTPGGAGFAFSRSW